MNNFGEKVSFIWSVADLLRGPYRPPEYGKVMLPLTVLRRLDCVLEPTKAKVLEAEAAQGQGRQEPRADPEPGAGPAFHNTSKLDFEKLKGEPDKIAANLTALHQGLLDPRPARSSTISASRSTSPSSTRPTGSTWSSRSSAEIDLHPDAVPTSRWATSSRN